MAIYRTIQLSFWTDNKIVDDFTPEDKYFYLYLFTNPQTNMCGCYEISLVTMANQTGYNKESVLRLLERFENVHKVLKYSAETKEILLLNWHKYNWQGGKQWHCIENEISKVKSDALRNELIAIFNQVTGKTEGACKGLVSPYQATVTVTDTDSVTDIVNYLNTVCGTKYSHKTKNTIKHIKARLSDGFTVEDFKTVIDKKAKEWKGNEMEQYLRPDTLFGTKFESYLNQRIVGSKLQNRVSVVDSWV